MLAVNNINCPEIIYYKSLRFTPKLHTDNKLFIAEGEKVVRRLLESRLQIESILLTKEYFDKYEDLITDRIADSEKVYLAEKQLMEQIVGFNIHTGIMAMAEIPDETEPLKMKAPIVALNGIVNSENTGSIVRNSVAFGFNSLILCEKSASPWLRRAVRVSMGNIFDMQFYHSEELKNTLIELKKSDYNIFAAELTSKAESFRETDYPDKSLIIFGAEGPGIDYDILELADKQIMIPVNPQVNSLNVASSSALILEQVRFKQKKS